MYATMSAAGRGGADANNEQMPICRHYARGMCKFGGTCRYIHRRSPQQQTSTTAPLSVPVVESCSSSNNAAIIRQSTKRPAVASSSSSSSSSTNASTSKHLSSIGSSLNSTDPKKWVLAPIFVPKRQQHCSGLITTTATPPDNGDQLFRTTTDECSGIASGGETYASVVGGHSGGSTFHGDSSNDATTTVILCPSKFNCPFDDLCPYEHNEQCDMCGRYCLHPTDKALRRNHIAQCIQQHEKDMELSFAIARSKDKTCGICFEIIMEKTGREQRFGILPNCNHIFCLECIRKWRQAKQFDNKIIRACPECRIPSDYVCPSAFWVETKDEKDKLIVEYKKVLGEKDCKYFKKGEGRCPFGNKCFYKHALPSGERVDVGVPKRNKRKIQRAEDEFLDLFDLYLWDFVDRRDFQWLEIVSNLSDSGDSYWSDDLE